MHVKCEESRIHGSESEFYVGGFPSYETFKKKAERNTYRSSKVQARTICESLRFV